MKTWKCCMLVAAAAWTLPLCAEDLPSAAPPAAADMAASQPCAGAACSAAPDASAPTAHVQVGDATRRLLQRQAQGDGASTLQYTQAGIVAQKVYERYVNSFKHPIPEHSTSAVTKTGSASR